MVWSDPAGVLDSAASHSTQDGTNSLAGISNLISTGILADAGPALIVDVKLKAGQRGQLHILQLLYAT